MNKRAEATCHPAFFARTDSGLSQTNPLRTVDCAETNADKPNCSKPVGHARILNAEELGSNVIKR